MLGVMFAFNQKKFWFAKAIMAWDILERSCYSGEYDIRIWELKAFGLIHLLREF
jgi:hypothetical protein